MQIHCKHKYINIEYNLFTVVLILKQFTAILPFPMFLSYQKKQQILYSRISKTKMQNYVTNSFLCASFFFPWGKRSQSTTMPVKSRTGMSSWPDSKSCLPPTPCTDSCRREGTNSKTVSIKTGKPVTTIISILK